MALFTRLGLTGTPAGNPFVSAPVCTATAFLTAGSSEFDADATFQLGPETYTATGMIITGGAEFAANGTVVNPTYTASAAIVAGGAEFTAAATFTAPIFVHAGLIRISIATIAVASATGTIFIPHASGTILCR